LAASSASGTDRTLALNLAGVLNLYGVPYDAAYTETLGSAKSKIQFTRAFQLSLWTSSTEICHFDTIQAINRAELRIGLPLTVAAFDSSRLGSTLVLAQLNARLANLLGNSFNPPRYSPLLQSEVDALNSFRSEINKVYLARPSSSAGSNDFTTTLILIPGVGQRTLEQVDKFLIRKVAEGAALRDLAAI